jgi:hypothetical protein
MSQISRQREAGKYNAFRVVVVSETIFRNLLLSQG